MIGFEVVLLVRCFKTYLIGIEELVYPPQPLPHTCSIQIAFHLKPLLLIFNNYAVYKSCASHTPSIQKTSSEVSWS